MLEENLPMRWLARDHTYSYHTINNFRQGQHASNLIKRSFVYFSMALTEHHLVQNDAVFIDGTKVEEMPISIPLPGVAQLKNTMAS